VAALCEFVGSLSQFDELSLKMTAQPVYWWIKEWKVERLVDALKLSRAPGIPTEKLAGLTSSGIRRLDRPPSVFLHEPCSRQITQRRVQPAKVR